MRFLVKSALSQSFALSRRPNTPHVPALTRLMSSSRDPLNRPSPPPLPRAQQREFEELVRKAQAPLSSTSEADLTMHPDARPPLEPEFEGDVNPVTGEKGGPKREPVKKWTEEGDWSFKGRVSDF
ncbi:hypothetical protein EUX98_g926 [Antrodiella citrinella]|uniref:Succinate dehydrogenase assembly factor 4, mitochondrial n=1 Tax=Antrodiella citrinella TaxID=2447956 RepID=A0A4V3XJJ0_9APHY|nr:hypothetical protein EUX98_g926 [Antrodiella citrinella]